MKYMIIEGQNSSGCDYTIGCGMRFKIVESDIPYSAFVERCARYAAYGGDAHGSHEDYGRVEFPNEYSPTELHIVNIDHIDTIDLQAFVARFNKPLDDQEASGQEVRDSALAKLSVSERKALGLT